MTLFTPTADVSVRPAVAGDETAITEIQLAAWQATHHEVLGPEVLELLDASGMEKQWQQAVTTPPGPGFAVFVACAGAQVVGFIAVSPGQIVSLEVAPQHRRRGHASRLLTAGVDRLRQDGATQVVTWILGPDDVRQQFFAGAGLGADGRRRTLAAGPREVTEERWSAAL